MRKLAPYFVVLLIVMQTILANAQTSEKPAPGFTLTLSMGWHGGEISKNIQVLVVKLTNISKEVIPRMVCDSYGEMNHLDVVYNGVPVEKTEAEQEYRKRWDAGDCHGGAGSAREEHTKPGESREDILYYDTTKPGRYEFTVTRETFPGQPEKSVTVRSNTITIVVPEPEANAPQ
jgi:hypothetical protein